MHAYATREEVARSFDVQATARSFDRVDRAVRAATEAVDGLLHRSFFPTLATRFFDWPDYSRNPTPWRLWLDQNELISVTSFVSGGVAIGPSDYHLNPSSGPPFSYVELDRSSNASFGGGSTPQRSIAITGLFGYDLNETAAGELSSAFSNSPTASAPLITWTTADVGVGDVLRIDNERLTVVDRYMLDSTQTLQTPLTASANDAAVSVQDGSAFQAGSLIVLDSERMLVVDITGDVLIVKRQWDGSALAAHAASAIYAQNGVVVDRAVLGTTLTSHNIAATVYKHRVPSLVKELAIAEAGNFYLQEKSGYARVVGTGENAIEATGKGLKDIRMQACARYGRKARNRAV